MIGWRLSLTLVRRLRGSTVGVRRARGRGAAPANLPRGHSRRGGGLEELAQGPLRQSAALSNIISTKLPNGRARAGGGMIRWNVREGSLHLRHVSVAGKPVGDAVRWYVHRPEFGVQGHLPSTAHPRGRTGTTVSSGPPHNSRRGGTRDGGASPRGVCAHKPATGRRRDPPHGGHAWRSRMPARADCSMSTTA